ncbi:MAG: hypothetical protein WC455_09985 [Dehalococcoidia bacterium]|jgi:uncharacterized phage infection (PIP) family protein YhgE
MPKPKPKSRATRYADLQENLQTVIDGITELRDELQDWQDNMPENLQGSAKYEELGDAIDQLEDTISTLEEITQGEMVFPTAF